MAGDDEHNGYAFNRTTVECKSGATVPSRWKCRAFNRTTVECKLKHIFMIYYTCLSFNRTTVECKLYSLADTPTVLYAL